MTMTAYPPLRLRLTPPPALKLRFLPAVPGFDAQLAADAAQAAADAAEQSAQDAAASAASAGNKVDRAGDTMTGDLTISKANGYLKINQTAAADAGIAWQHNGINRWTFDMEGTETGSNTGSDLALYNMNDAGGFTSPCITISRATGTTTFNRSINVQPPSNVGSNAGVTTGVNGEGFEYNLIYVQNDQRNQIAPSAATFGLSCYLQTGGSSAAGRKYALGATTLVTGHQDDDCIGALLASKSAVSQGGTAPTQAGSVGAIWGMQSWALLDSAATNYGVISGGEIDVQMNAGASAWIRYGLSVIGLGVGQGNQFDGAYNVGSLGAPWKTGILLNGGAAPALTTGGTVVAFTEPATIGNGIDLSNVAITGDFLKGPGFRVTGVGDVFVSKPAPRIAVDCTSTEPGAVSWQRNGLFQWSMQSGDDTGTDLTVFRFDNAGVLIDSVMAISRTTGQILLTHPLNLSGDPVGALQAAPKQYVDTKQPLDGDLTALAALSGTNTIYFRSAADTWSPVVMGGNMTFSGGVLNSTGGGGGAPTTAEYITASADATLSAERVLTNTATITWDFSTPGQAKANTAAGGGNVSNSGTPTATNYARWVTATTIEGRTTAQVLSDIGAQAADADLTSWAGVTRAAGFDTFAATPSSANLATLVTGETGSGALVFATSPTLVTPALGTPSSGTLTNCSGLPTILHANEATDTTCFVTFATAATGELGPKTNANLTYNANTGAFSIGTAAALTAGTIELGVASDTTLSRSAAGTLAVEGVAVLTTATGVQKAGDTMTGDLAISKATPTLTLNRPAAGTTNSIVGQNNALNRWMVAFGGSGSETGSNAGSDFSINAYTDAGAYLSTPISITRSSALVAVNGTLQLGGSATPSIAFSPTSGSTKSAQIQQSADVIYYGSSAVPNNHYIDLNGGYSYFNNNQGAATGLVDVLRLTNAGTNAGDGPMIAFYWSNAGQLGAQIAMYPKAAAAGDLLLRTGNGAAPTNKLGVTAAGNIVIGDAISPAALATTATNGFLYIPACAGAPTGTPTTYTGHVPMVYDSTNNKLYVYNGGWKGVTLA